MKPRHIAALVLVVSCLGNSGCLVDPSGVILNSVSGNSNTCQAEIAQQPPATRSATKTHAKGNTWLCEEDGNWHLQTATPGAN